MEKEGAGQVEQSNQEKENQKSLSNLKQELKNIDVYQHLRRNILEPKINCKETLSEEIFYCITCKQSTCKQCSLIKHQNHKIYPKTFFYSYTKDFFDEVQNILKDSYNIKNDKDSYIALIEMNAKELHDKIDEIKNKKIIEINNIFKKAIESFKELEHHTNEVKNTIEKFYKTQTDFFNVVKNNDLDNSIFLLYYELNYLGYSKNNELIKKIEKLKNDFVKYKEHFDIHKNKTIQTLEEFLGLEEPTTNTDDLYWDIKFRIKTYNELIEKLKQNIYDIMKHSGGINDLKELITILDSKNKRGIQYIFNQEYFTKNQNSKNKNLEKEKSNDIINANNDIKVINNNTIEAKRRDYNIKKVNLTRKAILSDKRSFNHAGKTERNSSVSSHNQNGKNYSNSNIHSQKSYNKKKYYTGKSNSFLNYHTLDCTKNSLIHIGIRSPKDITLDDKIKKKFFTYSFIDLYNKLFSQQPRKSFDNNKRIYADYNKRNNELKEYVKPIIGTNKDTKFTYFSNKS